MRYESFFPSLRTIQVEMLNGEAVEVITHSLNRSHITGFNFLKLCSNLYWIILTILNHRGKGSP